VYKAVPNLRKPLSVINNLEIMKAQILGRVKEGNVGGNKLLAMTPALVKILEKVCKGMCASVRPHRHTCGNCDKTVANVDASDSRCRCMSKIIAKDLRLMVSRISNNPSFRLKHPGVPDGSGGSDGSSY
jgi:hypothetical protein